jgi:hypothetical protein
MLARALLAIVLIGQSGGSALTPTDVQRVVQKNATAVKNACWGLDAGTSEVRLTVEINIAASGKVQSARAAGNDRSVSRCVEDQVKTWVFPASDGPTKVSVPFHFVRTP